ncbi:MAG: SAM-dependent chlorinase/fluorinase [Calditrichaeota bacterium]|nr:SAM-dependent chlorinase/fluorinase [Calditrichota bacterium]
MGTMKGVILGIHPAMQIIDITHQIPPQDVEAAAFVLQNSYRFFPAGAIHLAVVDPGVGTQRRIIIAETERYFFVAPDNALLKYIFHEDHIKRVVEATNRDFFRREISRTFHGRDIFAPLSAHLALGISLDKFGNEIHDYARGEIKLPVIEDKKIRGQIIYIDHFGNLITNIPTSSLKISRFFSISVGTLTIKKLSNSYAEVEKDEPVALFGSSAYLEIGIRNGNASEKLHIQRDEEVIVTMI